MIEFTPLYVGNMRSHEIEYTYSPLGIVHKKKIGAVIEPFAFGRYAMKNFFFFVFFF